MTARVEYSVTVSKPGSYSNVRVSIADDVGEGETSREALSRVRKIVQDRVKADLQKLGDLGGWS
ncbi:MAG TPA: hypothetical protein VGV64_07770 [Thermoplasmata archaeon]|nr:hypothetical protein [Thermoplasmata archaeon]HEV2429720.1 hypothetical protein [Thermoplasmata archaeon]